MSGHSKWKNIMHKKEKNDSARASVFTKIGKEMSIAVREGGPDPNSNSRLRDLIAKAKANKKLLEANDLIAQRFGENAVRFGHELRTYRETTGSSAKTTDNRNRTAADIRHYFDKYGGNLGTTGCVSFMFSEKGVIVVDAESVRSEEKFMEDTMECGAEDFTGDEECYEVVTEPADLETVRDGLEKLGYKIVSAEKEKVPANYVQLNEEQAEKLRKMLDILDENDDVQNVWHNWEEE